MQFGEDRMRVCNLEAEWKHEVSFCHNHVEVVWENSATVADCNYRQIKGKTCPCEWCGFKHMFKLHGTRRVILMVACTCTYVSDTASSGIRWVVNHDLPMLHDYSVQIPAARATAWWRRKRQVPNVTYKTTCESTEFYDLVPFLEDSVIDINN